MDRIVSWIQRLKGVFKRPVSPHALADRDVSSSCSKVSSFGGFFSYDTGQSYRLMAWIARLLGIGFCLSMLVNMVLVGLCCGLFPLKEVQPWLVGLKDKGDQVVQIQRVVKNVEGMNQLKEGLCRRYVTLRETIDCLTEEQRWFKELYYFCSPDIWSEFFDRMNPKLASSPLVTHQEKKAIRSVFIVMSTRLTEDKDIYEVEWESVTTLPPQHGQKEGSEERKRWVSILEIELRPFSVQKEAEFINPVGFTVVNYRVARKINHDEKKKEF